MTDQLRLRDGSVVDDPRLGRLKSFDDRSRRFSVAETLDITGRQWKGRHWYHPVFIDQGINPGDIKKWDPSSCTGCSATLDLAASPIPVKLPGTKKRPDFHFAFSVYQLAKQLDPWPGEDYEGSSVLAAAQALKRLGFIGEYRWAFNMDDYCAAISNVGGGVSGTDWYHSMFDPRPSGLLEIDPSSGVAGGHAYYIPLISVSRDGIRRRLGKGEPIREQDALLGVFNTWWDPTQPRSSMWGKNGMAYFWASDYERYLMPGGDQRITTTAFHSP